VGFTGSGKFVYFRSLLIDCPPLAGRSSPAKFLRHACRGEQFGLAGARL